MNNVTVTDFKLEHVEAYIQLNLEWIKTHFWVEPMDIAQLEDPKGKILNPGGEIFFVLENGLAVGTCAMVPQGPNCYELAKMAVKPSCRGKGYGDILMKRAIEWAQEKGADRILLLSNTVLEPAIALYKKHGFQVLHLGEHPDYKRCNIEMELKLT